MKTFFRLSFLILFMSAYVLNGQSVRVYKAPEFVAGWNLPSQQPDRIVLTPTEDPAHSMSVNWRTSTDVKTAYTEIAKATAAPKFWRTSKTITASTETLDVKKIKYAELEANYHSATFTGLEPNTMYGYRVGDGKHWSEWFQFKTASDKADAFSFLYVGDAQNYILELWSRLIRQGYKSNPDASFIIHAGDLVNHANNDQQWHEWFQAGSFIHSMVPSFPVPGNHEYRPIVEDGERQLSVFWQSQFNLPLNGPEGLKESVYYMDYQGMRMIGLNTNERNQKQLDWLEKVLKNNPNQWTVVTFHHPLYSGSEGRNNEELRQMLKPLFDKYHVDLVLQGHDHTYARGRVEPVEYNLTSGVNKRDQTGTVYVVSVSGGKMYKLRPNAWEDWDAERERAAENTQLIQSIHIDGDVLRYESITATGELYDAFEIIKNKKGTNTFVELRTKAIPERYHNNTISYDDFMPEDLKAKIMKQYKGHTFSSVSVHEHDGKIFYRMKLYNANKKKVYVNVDEQGNVVEHD